ncbi:hypothetical protein Q1695_002036 [Nippostrongylus brasiliensis]|nr:hypothetical protein Q1695_002036 [Nippostrongylus brasiliensis]
MSGFSSDDEYTEEDLLRVCEELGLPFDAENVNILKDAIDEIIAECHSSDFASQEPSSLDTSLFGSLSLSNSPPSVKSSTSDNISSPIRRVGHHSSGQDRTSEGEEVPLGIPTTQENEEMRRHNPTAYFLINDAFRCLGNVYRNMAAMEDLQKKLESAYDPKPYLKARMAPKPPTPQQPPPKPSTENKENQAKTTDQIPRRNDFEGYCRPFASSNYIGHDIGLPTDIRQTQPDPSLRPVDQLAPGKLLYRHDPVKKFELYREEWARQPAPGEQKRLALRWKVREYMLRQDLPSFDPRKPRYPFAVHPKDWSPRPYLD